MKVLGRKKIRGMQRIICMLLPVILLVADFSYLGAEENIVIKKQPILKETMVMYQGEKCYLDVTNVGGESKVLLESDDPKIVEVSKNGRLEARQCGKTVVTVTMKKRDRVSLAKINVAVRYSTVYQTRDYGKKITKDPKNTDAPHIHFHKELQAGASAQVELAGLTKDAEIAYTSSKPDIVTVDADGKVTAKTKGQATVRIYVKQNDRSYYFYEIYHVTDAPEAKKISDSELNQWFANAGFVGNSISLGLKYYFDRQKSGFLGNPTMMVKECYSFANDSSSSNSYKVRYKGVPYKAKDAIAKSGVDRVFICMGTNDLGAGAVATYRNYVKYIEGIRKQNPKTVIFIEATTPVYAGHEKGHLSNKNVTSLNLLMESYCKTKNDMYFVDICTPMKNKSGTLDSKYCSDRYVHLTNSAYELWTSIVKDYVADLLLQERIAKDAVITAEQSGRSVDYDRALKLVSKLEKSTVQTELKNRLKKVKKAGLRSVEAAVMPVAAEEIVIEPDPDISENVSGEISEADDAETDEQEESLDAVAITEVQSKSNTYLRITWEKNEKAGYYRLYRSNKKDSGYKQIALTKKTAYADRELTKNTIYYYKVQACMSRKKSDLDSKLSKPKPGHTRNVAKKIVFAGDSIMTGLTVYQKAKNIETPASTVVVAGKGLGTLTFQTKSLFDGMTGLEKVISCKPDRVYLMLGMNEISYRKLDQMLDSYAEIIEQLKDECPKSEIVLLAVSPVSRAKSKNGFGNIDLWNKKIKTLAKDEQVYYYDYTSVLKDKDGYLKYHGKDGIHWSPAGYDVFVKQMSACEKKYNQ